MSLAFGSFKTRSERRSLFDDPNAELTNVCRFSEKLDRWFGGHSAILGFLTAASTRWTGPISVLDLGCAGGALSEAILKWGKSRGIDVRVHGSDTNPALIKAARHRQVRNELTFESRLLTDPFFLLAQQFDYVVGLGSLNRLAEGEVAIFLKIANRQARQGLIFVDWLRDPRPAFYFSIFSRLSSDPLVRDAADLAIRRGFTLKEADAARDAAGLNFAKTRVKLGYRFSIEGERALVLGRELAPGIGLAGA